MIDPNPESIAFNALEHSAIGAEVILQANEQFKVRFFTGGLKVVRSSLETLDDACEDTMEKLINKLDCSKQIDFILLDSMALFAGLFIVLHEYAHIAAGHFNHMCSPGKRDGSIRFSETEHSFTLSFNNYEQAPAFTTHLFEIEADALAFHLLYEFRYELFDAFWSDIPELSPIFSAKEVKNSGISEALGELMFYAAGLAIGLLDIEHRKLAQDHDTHPWPFTRVLHLSEQLCHTRLPIEKTVNDLAYVKLPEDENLLSTLIAEPLISCYCLIQLACENLQHDVNALIQSDRKNTFVGALNHDLIQLIKNDSDNVFLTQEAKQWKQLKTAKSDYDQVMTEFRRVSWWQRSAQS